MRELTAASWQPGAVPWAFGGTGARWLRLLPGTLAVVDAMHAALVSAVVVVVVVVVIGGADESPRRDLVFFRGDRWVDLACARRGTTGAT